ncbi:MAG: hypothetical protein JWP91_2075 [Fibrobacteres bacterium]|nr:hypothetical protein [Fibrobacterota bacterium]
MRSDSPSLVPCPGLLPCILFCLLAMPGHAEVTGTVKDDTGAPIAGAFIRCADPADPSRETSAFADASGGYSLTLPVRPTALERIPSQGPGSGGAWPAPASTPYIAPRHSLTGRSLWGNPGPGEGPWYRKQAGTEAARPGLQDRSPAPLAKAGAEFPCQVTVTGKGVYPYRAGNVLLSDGGVRDFRLAATGLWASDRIVLRDDLASSAYRFGILKQGRVAFLGGSITYNPGWRDSIQNHLKRRFPQTSFEFINAGIPSVGSNMHGFRLRRDVLEKGRIDLLFLESAVNDTTNGVPSIERTRAYEGIVRQALKANPAMDIVFLYFIDPSFYPNIKAGKPVAPMVDYEKTAWRYGIPSINLAQYVAEHYTWEEFGANVHPGPLGQGIYSKGIARLLDSAWGRTSASSAVPPAHPLPARMQDSLCYHQGHTDSISRAVLVHGWRRIDSWKPAQGGTREGFVNVPVLESTTPGDTLKLAFTGTAVGMVIPSGYDAGMIDYSIDGKAMGTRDLFTPWSSSLHIPWTILFSGDLPMKAHELTLVMAAARNPASQGHACRIIRFLVNGPDT